MNIYGNIGRWPIKISCIPYDYDDLPSGNLT
jgi:hypothetical protein